MKMLMAIIIIAFLVLALAVSHKTSKLNRRLNRVIRAMNAIHGSWVPVKPSTQKQEGEG